MVKSQNMGRNGISMGKAQLYRICLLCLIWTPLEASLEFTDCEIGNAVKIKAECATLAVPENPTAPYQADTANSIKLHIARLPAYAPKSQKNKDPLTFIAGGPGQAAIETYTTIGHAFEKIREHRDIILVDQRGTGRSQAMICPDDDQSTGPFEFDPIKVAAQAQACLQSLAANPQFYTTSVAVLDLDQVREYLGIETWNIYGVSYGTRVALHYLRQHPNRVRSLILDAIVPPDVPLGANLSIDAQRALERVIQRCTDTTECHESFPDLKRSTEELLASLKNQPQNIVFEDFNSGKLQEMEFTYNHLALTIRMLSYTEHGVALLPVLIDTAYKQKNFSPLARQSLLQTKNLQKSLATGMHYAVICTEDAPYFDNSAAALARLDETYLGTTPNTTVSTICAEWPEGVMDENFRQAIESNTPALLLSGDTDPITPPEYGDKVAASLTNAKHIINRNQGHTQAHLGCVPTLMQLFITNLNPHSLDTSCLERLQPEPFFIDVNGPTP